MARIVLSQWSMKLAISYDGLHWKAQHPYTGQIVAKATTETLLRIKLRQLGYSY